MDFAVSFDGDHGHGSSQEFAPDVSSLNGVEGCEESGGLEEDTQVAEPVGVSKCI